MTTKEIEIDEACQPLRAEIVRLKTEQETLVSEAEAGCFRRIVRMIQCACPACGHLTNEDGCANCLHNHIRLLCEEMKEKEKDTERLNWLEFSIFKITTDLKSNGYHAVTYGGEEFTGKGIREALDGAIKRSRKG